MLKLRLFAYALVALFLVNLVSAATIYGTIYDLSLKKLSNVRVEINTSPKQFLVAQNGSYSFNVPNGAYTIKAELLQKNNVIASVQENLTIKQSGDYVLDLILFPNVEEGVEDINLDVDGVVETNNNRAILIVLVVVLFLIFVIVVYYFAKKKQKKHTIEEAKEDKKSEEEIDDLEQLIQIIKHRDGRTTQKDIRKQIPLSEAKISLMIAELEHKGVIEKIKKGRGNIIILKKGK